MKLLTKEIERRLPPLYATEDLPHGEKIVQVKFFTPDSCWTWYAIEACAVVLDGEGGSIEVPLQEISPDDQVVDVVFFGLVSGLDVEAGYFYLGELQSVRGPFGLPVERDLWFRPKPLNRVPEYKDWVGREGT